MPANHMEHTIERHLTAVTGKIDVRKLTPQQYREIRAKNPELLGLAPKRR